MIVSNSRGAPPLPGSLSRDSGCRERRGRAIGQTLPVGTELQDPQLPGRTCGGPSSPGGARTGSPPLLGEDFGRCGETPDFRSLSLLALGGGFVPKSRWEEARPPSTQGLRFFPGTFPSGAEFRSPSVRVSGHGLDGLLTWTGPKPTPSLLPRSPLAPAFLGWVS